MAHIFTATSLLTLRHEQQMRTCEFPLRLCIPFAINGYADKSRDQLVSVCASLGYSSLVHTIEGEVSLWAGHSQGKWRTSEKSRLKKSKDTAKVLW